MDQAPQQWLPAGPVVPPRRRRWVVPVIIVSVIVVVALIGTGLVFTARLLTASLFSRPVVEQTLVEGAPGSPLAVTPLDCAAPCFTPATIDAVLPNEASFAQFGTPEATFPSGTYEPTTVEELYRAGTAGWKANSGTPDVCAFAPSNAPFLSSIDPATAGVQDPVYFIGTHEDADRYNSIDQAARLFPDSASAAAFMQDLAVNIEGCETITIGVGDDLYVAEIDPEAALSVPDEVAAVGWVRTGDPGQRWRAYVVDVQRGNLVVRTRLLTDGSITEPEFRSFVEGYARLVTQLPPG